MTGGQVYLIGAGPGDPGLLTLKAARILEMADVIVYDHLVADAILDRIPSRAERIYAGKEAGCHTMNQGAINALLEERARGGQTVGRLKGGDPFVFGRGGEEAEYLAAHGIPFEVVPGVTSAIAVPAYAGIPVTHRGVAASLAIVTGRAGPIGEAPDVEWERIAGVDTVVVLMGVANHDELIRRLIAGGRSPETPVAAIRWGTTAQQRVVVGTLETIAARMQEANLRPPGILVVGAVVSLIPRMCWAETRPLFGRRVLLPASHPSPLTEPLERLGAEVLHVAPVEVRAPASWRALDAALTGLRDFVGIAFADNAGVEVFFERLAASGRDARAIGGLRVIARGELAAAALREHGLRADSVMGLAEDEILAEEARGGCWLVVGSSELQAEVAARLQHQGASTESPPVCAYSFPKWRADRLRELLTSRPVHAIALMDAAEVRQLFAALDPEERQALRGVILAASGNATGQALRNVGLTPAVTVTEPSPEALAHGLAAAMTLATASCSA